ncbi:MAG: hypothetical protein PHR68_02635 [Candidatus Gracilibacteria bacterium]|nr:hypothetical protein [Candidatus Gracilibacteria bacterium]
MNNSTEKEKNSMNFSTTVCLIRLFIIISGITYLQVTSSSL